jgi:hypothetical protein
MYYLKKKAFIFKFCVFHRKLVLNFRNKIDALNSVVNRLADPKVKIKKKYLD